MKNRTAAAVAILVVLSIVSANGVAQATVSKPPVPQPARPAAVIKLLKPSLLDGQQNLPTIALEPLPGGHAASFRVGSRLRGTTGNWTGGPTFTYAWKRCSAAGAGCGMIPGESTNSYLLAAADGGHTIHLEVTASNNAGATIASSGASPLIDHALGASPQLHAGVQSEPRIHLDETVGPGQPHEFGVSRQLNGFAGEWSGSPSFAYQWQRCETPSNCSVIAGATAHSYVLAEADINKLVSVKILATNPAGSTAAVSEPSRRVPLPPAPELKPGSQVQIVMSNAASGDRVGTTIRGEPGVWLDRPTLVLAWKRCDTHGTCVVIAGATGTDYVLTSADVDVRLVFEVTATHLGSTTRMSSAATRKIRA